MQEPQESEPLVAIVDDDSSVRRGLQRLIRSAGWKTETFASAPEFLARPLADAPSCLVLDLQLPGWSGLHTAAANGRPWAGRPRRLFTGHGDIPAAVQAMKAGAIEFLTKPVDEQNLLKAIQEAIERDRRTTKERARRCAS
jgi:FixJ family two-component response regulator